MDNFYDRIAKKYGGYDFSDSRPKYISEYPGDDPEKVFLEKVIGFAGANKIALDVGCGDGKFAFKIANNFLKIIGLDSSKELIAIAKSKKKKLKNENVTFVFGEAERMLFEDGSFDVIFNRRGPSFYNEYYRLLKRGGYYVEIGIGERDAMDLKKIFRRGQNYGDWKLSRLKKDKNEFKKIGFRIIYAKDFKYYEYYLSDHEFEVFLLGVPIFEDFNPQKDKKKLETYYRKHRSNKRIVLTRHRVVYMIQK